MICLHHVFQVHFIRMRVLLLVVLLLPPSDPPFSLSPPAVASAAAVSNERPDREAGHVSDKSMTVDHKSVITDRDNIAVAREFFMQGTAALRRPRNCSGFLPDFYRQLLMPSRNNNTQLNTTDATIARQVFGNPTCVLYSVQVQYKWFIWLCRAWSKAYLR